MLTYLQPLVDQLNDLYHQGIRNRSSKILLSKLMLDLFIMSGIQVCTSDRNFTSSGIGLLCSADMPARALISNMKAFNGSYACSTCEDEGATVPGNTLHRIWPFSDSNTLRTQDRMYSAIVTSVQQGQPVSLGASLVCVASNYSVSFESLFSLASLGVKFMYCNILAAAIHTIASGACV